MRQVHYLSADIIGTPRINTDAIGSVIARHDYFPFGEEIFSTSNRHPGNLYGSDTIRKKFASYQQDDESGLDYAKARYFSNRAGRFISADPLLTSGELTNPQTWNKYSYAVNNPERLSDPSGMMWVYHLLDEKRRIYGIAWINGNSIPKHLQKKGYSALGFNGQKSRDFRLTDGSAVRLNANSGHPTILRGPDAARSETGYVNTELVRETAKYTEPIPRATAAFAGVSILGGLTGGALLSTSGVLSGSGLTTLGLDGATGATTSTSAATVSMAEVDAKIADELENPATRGLARQLLNHQSKLMEYIRNPLAHDNLGALRNAPSQEIAEQIYRSRVINLIHQVNNFWKQIQ